MLLVKKFSNHKISAALLLLLINSTVIYSASPKNDTDQKQVTAPLFPKPLRPRKALRTAQEREENSILQTLDELIQIAEGLSKFTQSKESQEATDAKKKLAERKEKDAEQRLKRQQQNRPRLGSSGGGSSYSPRNPYGGGYGSPYGGGYGGYGGSSPWSGAGRAHSPWPSSSSSGYAPSRSNQYRNSFGFDDFDDDEQSSKIKNKTVNKMYGGAHEPLQREHEMHYTQLVRNTDEAARLLEEALVLTKKSGSANEKTAVLLANKQFESLQGSLPMLLESAKKAHINLTQSELEHFESIRQGSYKKAQDRFNNAARTLLPYALLAGTIVQGEEAFTESLTDDQQHARSLLKLTHMAPVLREKKDLIEQRARQLLKHWKKEWDKGDRKKDLLQKISTYKTLLDKQKTAPPTISAAEEVQLSNLKESLIRQRDDIKQEVETLIKTLPRAPEKPDDMRSLIQDAQAPIDKILQGT